MNAYKCDRCGKLFEPITIKGKKDIYGSDYILLSQLSGGGYEYNKKYYDLCPECKKELERWLKGGAVLP